MANNIYSRNAYGRAARRKRPKAGIPKAPNVLGAQGVATNAPGPGQPGWNPGGSYARPINSPAPASPAPAAAGPRPTFLDPTWDAAQNIYQRNTAAAKSFAEYSRGALDSEFGGSDGKIDWANIAAGTNVANPHSRAMLLQQSYKTGQRGIGGSYSARGQLYSGVRQLALEEGTRQFDVGKGQLQQTYSRGRQEIDQAERDALREQDNFRDDEHAAHLERYAASPASAAPAPAAAPAAPAAPTYHPVVQQTMNQAQRMWRSGNRGGRDWRPIISILGYDPRPGNRAQPPPAGAWRL